MARWRQAAKLLPILWYALNMVGHCAPKYEFEFEGYSVPGGYYEIVVYHFPKGSKTELHRITEPTMKGAFDKLDELGLKVVD
jgi:hypothetical protein